MKPMDFADLDRAIAAAWTSRVVTDLRNRNMGFGEITIALAVSRS